jgi:hypothetical protein
MPESIIIVVDIIGCSIAHELAKAEPFPSQQFLSKET